MASTNAVVLFALLVATAASAVAPLGTDATLDAIAALDTDRSGKVEKNEVEAFARTQGLSADEVRSEFRSLDTNGNGELEASEISQTLTDDTQQAFTQAIGAPLLAAPASPVLAAPASPAHQQLPTVPSTEEDAQRHAGKALAEVFARTAAKALEARGQDAEKATKLEEAARSLRGQTAAIRRTAGALTVQAARHAAETILREAEGQIEELKVQANEAEKQASERRTEAREAMQRAMSAQASMAAALRQRDVP